MYELEDFQADVYNYRGKESINFLERTKSFTFAYVRLASDGMSGVSSCHFLRALFRLLSEFLIVQTARGAQARKRKAPRRGGKEKEKRKKRKQKRWV